MNHAHIYCKTPAAVPTPDLINAVHQSLMQLRAIGARCEVGGTVLDNAPAIAECERLLKQAGHIGL